MPGCNPLVHRPASWPPNPNALKGSSLRPLFGQLTILSTWPPNRPTLQHKQQADNGYSKMAASLFYAGFAAFLRAISLSRSAAPICFLPSYSLVSLSPEKMRTSSRVVDTIAPGSANLDHPCDGQLMIVNCATLLECFLQRWFPLVCLGFRLLRSCLLNKLSLRCVFQSLVWVSHYAHFW
jgi:hypothetical protein